MKAKAILASLLMLVAVGLSAQEKAPVKKYGFKSAIAKFATEVMGQAVESTIYIDEYGAKECQKAKVEVPGMGTMESGVISKEGKTWNVNYTMKQVQEVAINPGDQPNFLDLNEETRKKFKIEEVGQEKVLDYDCTVYTLVTTSGEISANAKLWVYKGLPMKTETEAMGMKVTNVVTEFKEDAMVLPQVFDVPKF